MQCVAQVYVYAVRARTKVPILAADFRLENGPRCACGWRLAICGRQLVRPDSAPRLSGLLLGCALALVFSRAIGGLLFETAPADPRVYALAVLVLLGAAVFALWTPARRAARTDAVDVLRNSL